VDRALPLPQQVDPPLVDVDADHRVLLPEQRGHRETDVSEPDNGH
jgi:hypothetical protein